MTFSHQSWKKWHREGQKIHLDKFLLYDQIKLSDHIGLPWLTCYHYHCIVGFAGVRAVSRKTPTYVIILSLSWSIQPRVCFRSSIDIDIDNDYNPGIYFISLLPPGIAMGATRQVILTVEREICHSHRWLHSGQKYLNLNVNILRN